MAVELWPETAWRFSGASYWWIQEFERAPSTLARAQKKFPALVENHVSRVRK